MIETLCCSSVQCTLLRLRSVIFQDSQRHNYQKKKLVRLQLERNLILLMSGRLSRNNKTALCTQYVRDSIGQRFLETARVSFVYNAFNDLLHKWS